MPMDNGFKLECEKKLGGKTQDDAKWPRLRLVLALAAVAVVAFPARSVPQQTTPPPRTPRPVLRPEANRVPDANEQMLMSEKNEKRQKFEAANTARKQQLDKESADLLLLAKDLNTQMEKLGDKPMTPRLVREAEVIELLAHDVKAKMKLTVGGS